MTAAKLQGAIQAIKSGDRQAGQQLLTEVLREDPGNETAWLWMSALVTGEKRRFCLEKVLSINPDHPQARQQLAKLESQAAGPPAPVAEQAVPPPPAPIPSEPTPYAVEQEPEPVVAPAAALELARPAVHVEPQPQVWLTPGKQLSSVIYLLGDVLLTFDVLPDRAAQLLGEIQNGVTMAQLQGLQEQFHLQNIQSVPLRRVSAVQLFGDALRVTATDSSGNERKINTTVDKDNAAAILQALQDRLGPAFQKRSRPIRRVAVAISALGLFLLTCCGTGGLYLLARSLLAAGSARLGGIAGVLQGLGPNGVLLIGGILMLVLLGALILSLARPGEEIVLERAARKNSGTR